jgi:serine/threonine-protein kinase
MEADYFSKGLTETIIARLSGLRDIYVVAEGGDVEPDLILQGGVQKLGNAVRINYALLHRKQDRSLGGDVVEGDVRGLFALQDECARGVARILRAELGLPIPYVAGKEPTQDVTAYDYYIRGRDYLRRYEHLENVNMAIDLFKKSLLRDSRFALAHAGLGESFWRKYEITHEKEWVPEAGSACEQAVSLDAELASAYVCLGTVQDGLGQYQGAADDFLKAVELDATNDDAYRGLGKAYEALGQPEEAERAFEQAIALHPSYWSGYHHLGWFYYRHARYEEAERAYKRAIDLAPDNARAYVSLLGIYFSMGRYEEAITAAQKAIRIRPSFAAYSNLGNVYMSLRRFEEAVEALEKAVEFDDAIYLVYGNLAKAYYRTPGKQDLARPTFERAIAMAEEQLKINPRNADVHILLGDYYAMTGNKEDALDHLQAALDSRPQDPEYLYWAGIIHNQLGETELALDWLERAVEYGYSTAEIRNTAELDNLRGRPRFEELLAGR